MTSGRWEHFHHGADIGVRGLGATMDEAFAQAAVAMVAVITDPSRIRAQHELAISVRAPDSELLLTDWLNAVIYEMSTRRMLFSRFDVQVNDGLLIASAWGEPLDVKRHRPAVEIKGATYTELRVGRSDRGWLAQCVVDV